MIEKDAHLAAWIEHAPPPAAGLAKLAHQWTAAVVVTSNAPLSRMEINDILLGFVERLANAVLDDPFDIDEVEGIGRGLVAMELTGKYALDATLRVLAIALPETLDANADAAVNLKVITLLGALSAGYVDAVRDNILRRQESMKKAVLRARDATEQALRASERRFRTLFSESVVGVAIGDIHGHIVSTNAALQKMLGYSAEELRQRTAFDLMPREDAERLAESYRRLLNGRHSSVRSEHQLIDRDGEPIWAHFAVTLIRKENGEADYPVAVIADISDLHLLQEQWRHQTLHDPLTGLVNRALFLSTMEMISGSLESKIKVTLCCFGLDGLTAINGGFGNHVGDRMIKIAADRLRSFFPDDLGSLARVDGDSFAVLIPNWTAQNVIELVDQALERIAEPMLVFGNELSVTASVGIVERTAEATDPSVLLRDAELTLVRAKNAGGAQWVWFDAEQGLRDQKNFRLAAGIPQALRSGQFTLEFQPMASLVDNALAGVEAVPLWTRPGRGVLDTTEFLAMAAHIGYVVPVSRWVLQRACEQAVRWRAEFGERAPLIAVSLPERHVRDHELIGQLRNILDDTGATPDQLQIEIGQGVANSLDDEQLDVMPILADMGFRLVIRDIGANGLVMTSYADLPIHGVRLAPEWIFTEGEPTDFVTYTISSAHHHNLTVYVPETNTAAQARALGRLGVDVGQGNHFGPSALPFEIDPMIETGTVD